MNIRPAQEKDLETCVRLSAEEPEFAFANGKYPDVAFFRLYLDTPYFLVGEEDGKIIGLAVGELLLGNEVALWFLVMHKDKRGKGLGSQLLKEYMRRMKALGREWILLGAIQQPEVVNFYKRQGFYEGKKQVEMLKSL